MYFYWGAASSNQINIASASKDYSLHSLNHPLYSPSADWHRVDTIAYSQLLWTWRLELTIHLLNDKCSDTRSEWLADCRASGYIFILILLPSDLPRELWATPQDMAHLANIHHFLKTRQFIISSAETFKYFVFRGKSDDMSSPVSKYLSKKWLFSSNETSVIWIRALVAVWSIWNVN